MDNILYASAQKNESFDPGVMGPEQLAIFAPFRRLIVQLNIMMPSIDDPTQPNCDQTC
jgi:hypothetical protein